MTTEHNQAWPIANRPQDRDCMGTELKFEPLGYIGPLPESIRVTDACGRSCLYLVAYTRIVHPTAEHRVACMTLQHDPDLMPQMLVVKDTVGNSCMYKPVDPRLTKDWVALDMPNASRH